VPDSFQSGTSFRTPKRFAQREAAEKTDRFWSARAPAPLSHGSVDIGDSVQEQLQWQITNFQFSILNRASGLKIGHCKWVIGH
jgi:hypothetical protein